MPNAILIERPSTHSERTSFALHVARQVAPVRC